MTTRGLTMNKDHTFENLNAAHLIWKRSRTWQRFGQFWMNKTDFKLPEDYLPGYSLWEEKDDRKAYGVIFGYLASVQKGS